MKNIKITIAYDGSEYLGWQNTKMGPSIEGTLLTVLEKVLQEKISLQAASRTDAGVHARSQIVNFITKKKDLDLVSLERALNSLLPPDIAVLKLEFALKDFHPTLDCQKKEYHYHLCSNQAQLPHNRHFSWHYPHSLNIELMRSMSQALIGKHDFAAFINCMNNKIPDDTIRELTRIDLIELPENRLRFEVEGRHFLYKMVRNIVGYLVYVGCGKLKPGAISQILASKDRKLGGITAPALGLTLFEINY
ncbi:MAG: tRNA pseudouridine38-40 synthase [Chlamydiales bacterium]|jgi:tRNA pseudouridine38-40 synthase